MEFVCNFKKCSEKLKNSAYITRGMHAFCYDHAEDIMLKDKICPVCSSHLSNEYGIIKQNLNPSKDCKSVSTTYA
jgi:hypothetical protein